MRNRLRARWGLALLLALAAAGAGCGGGSSKGGGEPASESLAGYPKGPTRQFIEPGGDNVVQEYGREATPAERKQVSATVEGWLAARANANWARACSYMHESSVKYVLSTGSFNAQKHFTSCGNAYAVLAGEESEPARDNIKDGVASLRIGAGHGYAQYHGKEGRDWVVPVRRDKQGNWKVAGLYPLERNK